MLRLRASPYSCSFVGPAAPECDRSPPRLPEEMSRVDALLVVRDSPDRARSLFTVLAAISVARSGLSPRSFALSLMCSYCRSRFGLDPRGTAGLPSQNSTSNYVVAIAAHYPYCHRQTRRRCSRRPTEAEISRGRVAARAARGLGSGPPELHRSSRKVQPYGYRGPSALIQLARSARSPGLPGRTADGLALHQLP